MAILTRWLSSRLHKVVMMTGVTLLAGGFVRPLVAPATAIPFSLDSPVAAPSLPIEGESGDQFCPTDLPAAMDAIVGRSQFGTAAWGVEVYALADGQSLYTHNSQRLFIPASNIKLLTTAAAIYTILEQSPDRLWTFQDDLNLVNRDSHNGRADELLRNIGGQSRVKAMLEPLGVDPDSYVQADGSGLSRSNKAEPSTFVALLKAMYETDESELFYNSLPIGGVSGTLRNRFKGTVVQGKVRAKTGTLNGVRALSGYLETDDYGTVIFSIMVNQPGQSGQTMLAAIDDMVLTMAQLEACD
ncbi:D-alanyl-D-alanine carboxypeptidase [Halomicronema sp. CCY15110]|uniref:D-alanyl-D-alanine carboxypeptidase n=1 Tax=Halomicronema sp. CCY15110 TaxID=2767773 RepID=UPI001EF2BE61|nr:D-alanyl-D-alanine carboxypeptidase [Halomicronema sp. CCY15110]